MGGFAIGPRSCVVVRDLRLRDRPTTRRAWLPLLVPPSSIDQPVVNLLPRETWCRFERESALSEVPRRRGRTGLLFEADFDGALRVRVPPVGLVPILENLNGWMRRPGEI